MIYKLKFTELVEDFAKTLKKACKRMKQKSL